MAKIKKLKQKDISKNVATDVGHSINRIKENEGRYTFLLVLLFMILFCFLGYYTLSFGKEKNVVKVDNEEFLENSPKILLTKEDIMEDSLGLDTKVYEIEIRNTETGKVKYQITFSEDLILAGDCECDGKAFKINSIRYSLDGKNVNSLANDDRIVKTGELAANEMEVVSIKMWLASNIKLKNNDNYHLHGHFNIEKVQ